MSLCLSSLGRVFMLPKKGLSNQARTFHRSLSLFTSKKARQGEFEQRHLSPLYVPRTDNQKEYMKYLGNQTIPMVVGIGPAGTGKTMFACIQAVNELNTGKIKKIIMTRPVVSVEEDIGFLPGNLIHKMNPWTRPMFDILLEYYSQKDIDSMLQSGVLEISPLGFMRGRTFKRAFIIADEMQNSTPTQMLMLLTRIGDGAKMVITGDLQQSDRMEMNGLAEFLRRMRDYKREVDSIRVIQLSAVDIQRSKIVSDILDIYNPTGGGVGGSGGGSGLVKSYSGGGGGSNIHDSALIPLMDSKRIEAKYIWKPDMV